MIQEEEGRSLLGPKKPEREDPISQGISRSRCLRFSPTTVLDKISSQEEKTKSTSLCLPGPYHGNLVSMKFPKGTLSSIRKNLHGGKKKWSRMSGSNGWGLSALGKLQMWGRRVAWARSAIQYTPSTAPRAALAGPGLIEWRSSRCLGGLEVPRLCSGGLRVVECPGEASGKRWLPRWGFLVRAPSLERHSHAIHGRLTGSRHYRSVPMFYCEAKYVSEGRSCGTVPNLAWKVFLLVIVSGRKNTLSQMNFKRILIGRRKLQL